MPYVMVPVPAEHEQELMTEVLMISVRERMRGWSDPSLSQLVSAASADARRLLQVISDAVLEGTPASHADVARILETDEADVVDRIMAINEVGAAQQRPSLIIEGPAPKGQRDDARSLVIVQEYARQIRVLIVGDAP